MITIASDGNGRNSARYSETRPGLGANNLQRLLEEKQQKMNLIVILLNGRKSKTITKLMERLQNAGVAAGAVISGLEVLSDSHLAAREFMLAS